MNYVKILTKILKTHLIQARLVQQVTSKNLPRVQKLKNVEKFEKLITSELTYLNDMFKNYNYELKIAGGAVRDLLLDIMPHDVDLATNALPQQMLDMFNRENIRVLNTNGIKHGTVPIRINDKV